MPPGGQPNPFGNMFQMFGGPAGINIGGGGQGLDLNNLLGSLGGLLGGLN